MEELHDDATEFEFSKQGLPSNVRRIAVKSARGRHNADLSGTILNPWINDCGTGKWSPPLTV